MKSSNIPTKLIYKNKEKKSFYQNKVFWQKISIMSCFMCT